MSFILTVIPAAIWKTREALLPLTVNPGAPLPSMVTLLSTTSCPEVRAMVPPARAGSKVIVPSLAMMSTASRREPAPLSASVVTVTAVGGGTGSTVTIQPGGSSWQTTIGQGEAVAPHLI